MKKTLKVVLSVILTILFLYIILYDINFELVLKKFVTIPISFFIIAFIFHLLSYIFRSAMLTLLISDNNVKYYDVLRVHFIHNFYVHTLPAGIGELSFPVLLKNKLKVSESIASLLISRVSLIIIALLLFILVVVMHNDYGIYALIKKISVTYYISLLLISTIAVFIIIRIKKILFRTSHSSKIQSIQLKLKDTFIKVRSIMVKPKTILILFSFGLASTITIYLFHYFILIGLNLEVEIYQTIFAASIGVVGYLLPIKTLGGFGTTEGPWIIALILLGFSRNTSTEAAFAIHLSQLVNVIILFVVGLTFSAFARSYEYKKHNS